MISTELATHHKIKFPQEKCALMVIRAAEFHPNEKGKHRHSSESPAWQKKNPNKSKTKTCPPP